MSARPDRPWARTTLPAEAKPSHNQLMSLSPFSSAPATPAPLTFREARDRLLELERRLSRRARGVLLAAAARVQLGARMVRRRARGGRAWAQGRAQGHRRACRDAVLRRACARVVAARQRPARAWRQARRSSPDDAGRRSRIVGDDAGVDEARPRADPGHADAGPSRHRRPDRARPGQISGRARG